MASKSSEYASYAATANAIDKEMQQLLDELVSTLQRSPAAGQLEERAKALAGEAARLAREWDGADEMEMNEKAVRLENLGEQAERLIAAAPDAIVASEHEHWSGELEAIQTHLQGLRGALDALALPHVTGTVRAGYERRARTMVAAARTRLQAAHEGIRLRSHVKNHRLHANLVRIHAAMKRVRINMGQTAAKAQAKVMQTQASEAGEQMRHFFQRELNGRLYVDASTIQMRSDLTGQVREWPHTAVHAQALGQMLAGTGLGRVLDSVRARKASCLAAKFECRNDASGLMVELTAGERSIVGDTIVFKPQVARILV